MTSRWHGFHLVLAAFVVASVLSGLRADERLKDIACRSVHLGYPAAESVAFYNEVTPDQSAPGTYFMACGWDKGYFGMQELGDGKKLLIFSVWDSPQNDPKAVAKDKRVKLLHKDDKVRIGRFGGEGSGGQSFFDYDWKIGQTYRFLVTAKPDGERTEYAGWFYVPEDKAWKHLVTFSTITGGKQLRGYYSFIEDFKRDRVSATKVRSAHFGNGWVQSKDGQWTPLTKARFTADRNPVTNINAVRDGERFVLATGGDTTNKDTKLNATMELPAKDKRTPPEGLPGVKSVVERLGAIRLAPLREMDKREKERSKRMLRWTLRFETKTGEDYIKQMQTLGAILAFPVKEGEYVIIRDLSKRPAKPKAEDVSKIERIYWIDDRPESVKDVCKILGVKGSPAHFVAFFPEKLERELLEKEGKYKGLKEEDIGETRFKVIRRDDKLEVKVIEQKSAKR